MTHAVDLYYTMRSPYCYLATPELVQLAAAYDLHFNLKVVYPLAVSDKTFFQRVNPLWPHYIRKDTKRIAERLSIPFLWPRPDPIIQDRETSTVAEDQPYIGRITRLTQVAAEQGRGLEYVACTSGLLYSPTVDSWMAGDNFKDAMAGAGFDLAAIDDTCEAEHDRLEADILQNRHDQLAAGHWGAPLFAFDGDAYFGRDRIEDVVFQLKKRGLKTR
jgi:2-hydroxychromene-2-carboxylate isomerase